MQQIERRLVIHAPRSAVWAALTEPALMTQWMGKPEMMLDVATDWSVGGPIVISGFHHVRFENRGTVLHFAPPEVLRYTHLSSLSRLPDVPENHSVLEFHLAPEGDDTALTVTLGGFPTEAILRHLDFYWRVAIGVLKQFVESRGSAPLGGSR